MAEPDTLEDLYAVSAAYAGLGIVLCMWAIHRPIRLRA